MRLSTRLLLVVATCLLPVIMLGVWVEYSHWSERRAQLGDLSLQEAQLLNGDVDSIAEGARILLSTIAQLDEVRDGTPACGERLSATERSLPMFAFVARLDANGEVVCASEPALKSSDGEQPQWVRDAVAATGFSAGRFATPQVSARESCRSHCRSRPFIPIAAECWWPDWISSGCPNICRGSDRPDRHSSPEAC